MTAAGISRRIAVVDDHYSKGAIVVHLPNKIHNIFHVQIFSQKDTNNFVRSVVVDHDATEAEGRGGCPS